MVARSRGRASPVDRQVLARGMLVDHGPAEAGWHDTEVCGELLDLTESDGAALAAEGVI